MKFEIFNVGHGHCSVITAPNGTRIMLDCGTRWEEDYFWTPSLHFLKQSVPLLIPLNLDEDHLADFGGVLKDCGVKTVITNLSIGVREFIAMKNAGMGPGAKAYLEWLSAPKMFGVAPSIDLGPVQVRVYSNVYGPELKKSNDLSLAVIIQYGSFKVLFAGDLEGKGWRALLARPEFVADLHGVAVFVASHHGRRSGCHEDLFQYLNPQIVVISDAEKQHESQETHSWYHWRCQGIPVLGTQGDKRHIYTTRSDGHMTIEVGTDGRWIITPGVQVRTWARSRTNGLLGNALNDPLGFSGLGFLNRR